MARYYVRQRGLHEDIEHVTRDREGRPELFDKVKVLCGSTVTVKGTPRKADYDFAPVECKRCNTITAEERWEANTGISRQQQRIRTSLD